MRSKSTNFLQVMVLVAGSFFILKGLAFFISPTFFAKVYSINVTEEWFNQIKIDESLVLLYLLSRGFSALLFTVGLSMILPLFDPLRYRGLIYFCCVLFPLMAGIMMIVFGITGGYRGVAVMGGIYACIFAGTLTALMATRSEAKKGIE